MTKFSLLDLVPVVEGGNVATALASAADLAVHAESLGFTRYWVAEHPLCSANISVVIKLRRDCYGGSYSNHIAGGCGA